MTDEILTDLMTAVVAAYADGEGLLTLKALRKRLGEAELSVERVGKKFDDTDTSLAFTKALERLRGKQ